MTATHTIVQTTVFNPKNGESIESVFTDEEAADYLHTHATENEFARSLVNQFWNRKNGLTQSQRVWLHTLAMKIAKPRNSGKSLGCCKRIFEMFANAAKHVKHPKIHISDSDGICFVLSRAPDTGKNPGHIYVKNQLNGNYYGKIDQTGKFHSSAPDCVAIFLSKFAQNPEETAAEYGFLSGRCCFCNRALSDERSTEVGYGAICASRYNLQWGARRFSFRKE